MICSTEQLTACGFRSICWKDRSDSSCRAIQFQSFCPVRFRFLMVGFYSRFHRLNWCKPVFCRKFDVLLCFLIISTKIQPHQQCVWLKGSTLPSWSVWDTRLWWIYLCINMHMWRINSTSAGVTLESIPQFWSRLLIPKCQAKNISFLEWTPIPKYMWCFRRNSGMLLLVGQVVKGILGDWREEVREWKRILE